MQMRHLGGTWVLAVALLGIGVEAHAAASFTVKDATVSDATGEQIINTFYPQLAGQGMGHDVATAVNTALAPFLQTFTQNVNTALNQLRMERFFTAMSNASAGAAKDLPVDYASDPSLFTLTVGGAATGNLAYGSSLAALVDLATTRNLLQAGQQELPAVGGMLNLTFMLGVNMRIFELPDLGPIQWSRLTLYGNFAGLDGGFNDFQMHYRSFGAHAQYRLVDQIPILPGGVLRWGGLSVGTGFDYASLVGDFSFTWPKQAITEVFTYQNQSLNADLAWSGTASLSAGFGAGSVPIEVMTSAQILYVFTLYAGGALDFNFGLSELNVLGAAPATISLRDPSINQSLKILQPSVALAFDEKAGPTVVDVRGFAGLQLNMLVAALFAQVNADSSRNYGFNFGFRAFW